MKKLIWLSFVILAGLWTAAIMLVLRLSDWLLGVVAQTRLPADLPQVPALPPGVPVPALPPGVPVPEWAAGWADSAWLAPLQQALMELARQLNTLLPMAGGLSSVIAMAAWVFWGLVMVALLALAIGLHWLAGQRQAQANRP